VGIRIERAGAIPGVVLEGAPTSARSGPTIPADPAAVVEVVPELGDDQAAGSTAARVADNVTAVREASVAAVGALDRARVLELLEE